MSKISLEEFDKFVIYGKTLELLGRYGIKPTSIDVGLELSPDHSHIRWGLFDRTIEYSYNPGVNPVISDTEQHERIKQLYTDLGGGLGIDDVDTILFTNYTELYDRLCNAIEKAPNSFTRRR